MQSREEIAKSLLKSLEEACSVHAEQQGNLVAIREQGERLGKGFKTFLQATLSGCNTEETRQYQKDWQEQSVTRLKSDTNSMQESMILDRRWKIALADIQTTLMRLYAFPEARESAEQIATCVRDIQNLQIEDTDSASLFSPSLTLSEDVSDPDKSEQIIAKTLGFFGQMDRYMDDMRKSHQKKIDRTTALLEQARDEAKALNLRFES